MQTSTKVIIFVTVVILALHIVIYSYRFGSKDLSESRQSNLDSAITVLAIFTFVWGLGVFVFLFREVRRKGLLDFGLIHGSSSATLGPLPLQSNSDMYPLTRRDSNISSTGNWGGSRGTLGGPNDNMYGDDQGATID